MVYQKTESQYRNDIIEICKRVHRNGWVASNDGNISIKIGPDSVLCTPTGMSKGYLTTDQLVKVDMDGNKLEGEMEASSEVKIHLDVFKNKPGINSAVHAHPPYSTAFAVAGLPLDQCVIPEIIVSLGSIPLTAYGTPSTQEIPNSIRKYLQDHNAFLMENHGAFTIGGDVYQAYYRMESMELFAKISLLAKTLGNVNNITEENVRKIIDLRSNFIKDDNGYAGCKIGDKLINSVGPSGENNINSSSSPGDNEMITLRKSELVEIVSKIVSNIVNK
ncbi:MAG TPA: class II aldolase family protein [Actinobacteria bacterium]|nr:class II aldolase family protein [Actinomycetota bacterium]